MYKKSAMRNQLRNGYQHSQPTQNKNRSQRWQNRREEHGYMLCMYVVSRVIIERSLDFGLVVENILLMGKTNKKEKKMDG
jgi:hypothetical protein